MFADLDLKDVTFCKSIHPIHLPGSNSKGLTESGFLLFWLSLSFGLESAN